MESTYEIRAAVVHIAVTVGERKIYSYPIQVGHHFWVLVKVSESGETLVDSLHGLATCFVTESDGTITARIPKLVGTWNSYLQLYSIPFSDALPVLKHSPKLSWIMPDVTYTAYSETDALVRWRRAKSLLNAFNAIQVPYSFLGVGKSLGLFRCKNSNSAYANIAFFLNVKHHCFENYAAPGITSKILSKEFTDHIEKQHQAYEALKAYRSVR